MPPPACGGIEGGAVEAAVHANLAVMIREKAGAATTDELEDPELKRLVSEGTVEELLGWLEAGP